MVSFFVYRSFALAAGVIRKVSSAAYKAEVRVIFH